MPVVRIAFFLIFIASSAFGQNPSMDIFFLENGMEFLLIPQKSAPMTAGSFVIRAGSADETDAESGAAHLLEHLLFNGTSKLTQKELYDEMDLLGGYFNASTSEDYANFVLLLERDNFPGGIDLLSQMLFDSTLPLENFEKEIKIVEKELVQKQDRKQYWADLFEKNIHFAGTPYSRPVLGSLASLANISRETVFNYYRKTYIPNNISAVIIGDFDVAEMQALLREKFDSIPPGSKTARRTDIPAAPNGGIHYSTLDSDRIHLTLSFDAPPFRSPDFYAFYVMNELINEGTLDFWGERMEKHDGVITASSSFNFSRQTSKFTISIDAKPDANVETLRMLALESLTKELKGHLKKIDLDRYMKNRKINEIYMRERIHYYGLYKAELLALGGVSYPAEFERQIGLVSKEDLINLAEKTFPRETPLPLASASGPFPKPETPSAEKQLPIKHILPNGMTLEILRDATSEVFAATLLARDRSPMEPEGKVGIAEILHRMTLKGAGGLNEPDLSQAFEKIGAEIKVMDNPYIPYDDYYFSPRFSYLRMKTVAEHGFDALKLLSDMVFKPNLNSSALEEVKKKAIDSAKAREESSKSTAMNIFYSKLYGRSYPYMNPPHGIISDMESIELKDLKTFHEAYFDPSNLILSVVSNKDPKYILETVEKLFSRPSRNKSALEPFVYPVTKGRQQSYKDLGGEQAYVFLGKVFEFNDENHESAEALSAAASILSNTLNFELREKQGLAYSMGASAAIRGKRGIVIASMGTSPEKADEAGNELLRAWSEFKNHIFTEDEITRTLNLDYGRQLMRSLTAENRAMKLALDVLEQNEATSRYSPPLERAQYLTPAKIGEIADAYLNIDDYILVVVK